MQKQKTPDRLRGYLRQYAEEYPGAWKMFEEIREDRGKDLPDWPSWCWCPLSGSYAIVNMLRDGIKDKSIEVMIEKISAVGALGALATWRITKGIYRFDPDLFAALWSTPLTGKLPAELLYRLPEWCVYVEVPPGYEMNDQALYGWFSHLEYHIQTGRTELRFVFDLEKGLASYMLHLSRITLEECIIETVEESKRQALKHSRKQDVKNLLEAIAATEEAEKEIIERQNISLAPFVSVLLYLCSVAADMNDAQGRRERPENPAPRKTKKGMRVFPVDGQTTWLVGYRVGAALRRGGAGQPGDTARRDAGTGGTHATPKPHIRRAHWHSYWVGPKKGARKQKLVVKWLHPTLVGGGEIVPTIRRVE